MIEYVQGDLFETDCDVIGHSCNCEYIFGSGVAGLIAKKFPLVKQYYENEPWHLGKIQFVPNYETGYRHHFLNMAGQYHPGADARLPALYCCMYQARELCLADNLSLAIPKIGSGIGGKNWDLEVGPMVEKLFQDSKVKLEIRYL